jgi:ABC-type branched-subunit amino acid transport system substrate-binding protein
MTRVGVVVAVVALAVATIAPVGASGAPKVRGFDGTTIKIAGFATKQNFPMSDIGTKARIKRFNDTNEIKGVKIQYTEYVDSSQSDPATALSEMRRLVTETGIFAIVPDLSAVNPGEYMNQQHVPYFGYGFDNTYCSTTPSDKLYGFSYTGCTIPENPKVVGDTYSGLYKYLVQKTGHKHPTAVLVSNDNQSGKSALNRSIVQAKGAGFKVVYAKAEVPEQSTDYSPYVQKWMTANNGKPPDHFQCVATLQCISMWDAVKPTGYKGTFWTGLYSDSLVKALGGTVSWGFFSTSPTPAFNQMMSDIQAVAPSQKLDSWVASAYFSADMFIQALKKAAAKGKSGITPENVQKAAAHMKWQIKGLVGPQTYPQATAAPTPDCLSLVADKDGSSWSTVLPYTCSAKKFPVTQSALKVG